MIRRHNSLIVTLLLAASMIFVIGCQAPVRDRSRINEYPPDVRPTQHGHLGAKELHGTTDAMLESIVASLPDLKRDEMGRTIVVADTLVNRTALPSQDLEIFMAQLRQKLNQSGARYQMVFVENPGRAAAVRGRVLEDGLKDDYRTPGTRPHYALTGDVHALDRFGERYWEVFFRMLDLDPDDPIRNRIIWEDSKGYLFVR